MATVIVPAFEEEKAGRRTSPFELVVTFPKVTVLPLITVVTVIFDLLGNAFIRGATGAPIVAFAVGAL